MTVLVAWVIAVRAPVLRSEAAPNSPWPVALDRFWPPNPDRHYVADGWLERTEYWVALWPLDCDGRDEYAITQSRFGFPWRSMQMHHWSLTYANRAPGFGGTDAWPVPRSVRSLVACERWLVPARVLPLGFAVDTAFYRALAFLLWSVPGVVRRHLWKRRGQCPACGYNLAGLRGGLCPECGT